MFLKKNLLKKASPLVQFFDWRRDLKNVVFVGLFEVRIVLLVLLYLKEVSRAKIPKILFARPLKSLPHLF